MTTDEALEIITNAVQSGGYDVTKDRALAIVQKAVEKQIPKKPLKEDDKYDACPLCGRVFLRREPACGLKIIQYCKWCGQLIDLGGYDDYR